MCVLCGVGWAASPLVASFRAGVGRRRRVGCPLPLVAWGLVGGGASLRVCLGLFFRGKAGKQSFSQDIIFLTNYI